LNAVFLADSFRKSFGSTVVLKAASAWATAGEITVLFGRNGCGKSTLLKCALGAHRAEQGSVHFSGEAIQRPRLWRLAVAGLFYLPDRGLLSRRRSFGVQLDYVTQRFGTTDSQEVADQLEVGSLLSAMPDEMSGGELRRAELTLAIARKPQCLIADEPLAEIEPRDRRIVASMLKDLANSGVAVLITGHEVHDLMALADQIIWMAAGTTHGLGSPEDAMVHDQFRREYLGPST
jgi:lipopolysaccharide export system ATP-binding protein